MLISSFEEWCCLTLLVPTQQVEPTEYCQMTSSSSSSSSSFSLSSIRRSLAFQQNTLTSSNNDSKKSHLLKLAVFPFLSLSAQHLTRENTMVNLGTKCTIQHESESLINTRKQNAGALSGSHKLIFTSLSRSPSGCCVVPSVRMFY